MFSIPPPFWSGINGDHETNDGRTLFQTLFAGAVTDDVSSYAIGAGTETGPSYITVTDGNLNITQTTTDVSTVTWSNSSFNIQSTTYDWCLEFFVKLTPNPANPAWEQKFGQITMGSFAVDFVMHETSSPGVNLMRADFPGPAYFYGPVNVANTGVFHHVAIIARAGGTGNMMDGYFQGTRVFTAQNWSASGSDGYIQLGASGTSAGGRSLSIDFSGVRVRNSQVYPQGTTITPPTSPAAWGPP